MNRKQKIRLLVCGLLLVGGCIARSAKQRYEDYLNDPVNKILQSIKVGDVKASLKWLPAEYRKMISRDEVAADSDQEKEKFYYFDAKFEKTEGEKPAKEKMLYLDFDMQKDFVLVSGSDSIPPAICQKVENGISGSYEYIVAFEKPVDRNGDNFNVLYKDKVFGIGTIAFVYRSEDINRIPKLKGKD
jgi:hypothetical protein